MAKKYIDAEQLKQTVETSMDMQDLYLPSHFFDVIDGIPTADVVEVVRCKDCIHYMPYDWMFSEVRKSENIEDYPQDEIGCEWMDHHINPDGYCSYGERKR